MACDGASDIVVVFVRDMAPFAHMMNVPRFSGAINAAIPVF
jgi:hypothetical protein